MKFDAKNINTKQKVMIVLIALSFVFVIWQFYGLFGDSSTSENAAQVKSATPPQTAQDTTTSSKPSVATAVTQSASSSPSTDTSPTPTNANPNDLAPTGEQTQYMLLMSQYQLLKMKHMLLDEEVAIATARQKIADLNSKTGDLGGDTGSSDLGIGGGDFGNSDLAYPSSSGKSDYKVVFIDHQNGEWNATLSRGGRFEEVNAGSELADGTQIISIDSNAVVIKKGATLAKLTFSGSTKIENSSETVDKKTEPAQPTLAPAVVEQAKHAAAQPNQTIPIKNSTQSLQNQDQDSSKKKKTQ